MSEKKLLFQTSNCCESTKETNHNTQKNQDSIDSSCQENDFSTISSTSDQSKQKLDKRTGFLIIGCFIIFVLFGLLYFIDGKENTDKSKEISQKKQKLDTQLKANAVLSNNTINTNIKAMHESLYKDLLVKSNLARLQQAFQKRSYISRDYQFFFNNCLKNYLDFHENKQKGVGESKNIIAKITKDHPYSAATLFNTASQPFVRFKDIQGERFYHNRILLTGTYTSSYSWPTGLAIDKGKVINPAIQQWDGLLIIDRFQRIHIVDINELILNFRKFSITKRYQDYIDFLSIAEKEKLTIIQSHLLVSKGQLQLSQQKRKKRCRRRAICQSENHSIFIFDSLQTNLTLWEMANKLIKKHNATEVLNLDMGPYNFCVIKKNGNNLVLGMPSDNIILSNLLIIDY